MSLFEMSSRLIKSEFKLTDLQNDPQEVLDYLRTLELQVALDGPQSLGFCQRAVLIAFRTQGSVEMGSLRSFYEAQGDPLEAVAAFVELGLYEAASAMEMSMEAFPPGLLQSDHREILDWMDENAYALEEQWYPLGLVIMHLTSADPDDSTYSTELLAAVRRYFSDNRIEFGFKR